LRLLALPVAALALTACAPVVETVDSIIGAITGRPAALPPGMLEVNVPYGTSAREACFVPGAPGFASLPTAPSILAAASAGGKYPPIENAPALRVRMYDPGEDGRFTPGDSFEIRVTPKSLFQPFTAVGRPYAVEGKVFVRFAAAGPGETLSVDVAAPAALELVVSSSEGRSGCFAMEVTRRRR